MRRAHVGKLGQQIAVRAYPIRRHFTVGDDSQEGIGHVVAERTAILRESRGALRVIAQDVRQQRPRPALLLPA